MNINEYLTNLNDQTKAILNDSLKYQTQLGKAHHLSSCIFEFSEQISDEAEKNILITVSSQLEAATLNAAMGLYRQAFASLRLAFEMGLGAAHFSVHKLEFSEWLDGHADIKWSTLVDEDNGVISKRFSNAFFKELNDDVQVYREKAILAYRNLSEYVHGNNETWARSGLKIRYNEPLLEFYFESFKSVVEVIIFVLTCRYIKSFDANELESLLFISEELSHICAIREAFGGPKV